MDSTPQPIRIWPASAETPVRDATADGVAAKSDSKPAASGSSTAAAPASSSSSSSSSTTASSKSAAATPAEKKSSTPASAPSVASTGVSPAPVAAAVPAAESKKPAEPTVSDILTTLEYGPAPETEEGVRAWITDHGGSFGLFINNRWVRPPHRGTLPSFNPSNGEVLASTLQATDEDVDLAVAAARRAYTTWSKTPGYVRARFLYAIARQVQKHSRLLSVLESMDNGKPIRESRDVDVPLVARHFYYYAGWAQLFETELAEYQPIGVVGQIIPWNFPLLMLAWKIAPAIACGNTVVLKPASFTRLTALLFAEICAEAQLPPGVVNIVTGSGRIGSTLACHPGVDKVAFTGSTEIGRMLRRSLAGTGKRLSLELGGKSPFIVFDSADLDSAVEGIVDAIWFNQGEVCCAGSRLIVQESVADRFLEKIRFRMRHLRVGKPTDKCIDIGAVVDESQLQSVSAFVERAREGGADVYQADIHVPEHGLFYPPTLITNVQPVSEVVMEEIFGPVLVAMTFRTPQEAVALANNTRFGLAGSVWTENIGLAVEVATQVKAGVVWVNAHNIFDAAAGFGGFRESGFGREGGREGLMEYVRPSWQSRPIPKEFDRSAKWGQSGIPDAIPRLREVEDSDGFESPATAAAGLDRYSIRGDKHTGSYESYDGHTHLMRIDRTPKMYINGTQKRPDGQYTYPVVSPSGSQIGQVGDGNRKDIRDAVEAAFGAAPGWGKRAAYNRAQILYYIAENLDARFDEFAHRIHEQTECGMDEARKEVQLSIRRLFTYAAYADKFGGLVQETTLYGLTVALNEPVGVVAMLCPDECPLLGFISLVAPAIVRGNTVIVVPSEKYPISATDLYQVFDTSDLPNGVVNIVTGKRDHLAHTLAAHREVDAIWYFGTALGSYHVESMSAENMKRSWVNYGLARDWTDIQQGEGHEFLHESVEVKNVWVPMGA